MNEIAKNHPVLSRWLDPSQGLIARIAGEVRCRGAHPARTVVLLPYAQLIPVAKKLWAQTCTDGFAPRFETTLTWSLGLSDFNPAATDLSFAMAVDMLNAQSMLDGVGLATVRDGLAPLVVAAAHQLAPLAAAVAPPHRKAWADRARQLGLVGMDAPALALEATAARIALEWVAQSAYASDVLFDNALTCDIDCLVALEGLSPDPMGSALAKLWGQKFARIAIDDPATPGLAAQRGSAHLNVALHQAMDAEDEAQLAAACVIAHIEAGRYPIALVANDRALTRRVRAMLGSRGIRLRDENGWKLSTSRSSASLMGALRASAWDASSDDVLDWAKNAPAFENRAVRLLEKELRRAQLRDWRLCKDIPALDSSALVTSINALRQGLHGSRPLQAWLTALRGVLKASGVWSQLAGDVAGDKLVAELRLADTPSTEWTALLETANWAQRNLSLAEFTAWVNVALEAASYLPANAGDEQVVILPMSQLLGRVFAATVMPGCDEVRLNPSKEPTGTWTPAQREALGLPSRATLEAAMRSAWHVALQTPCCDVLWRTSDESGETLLPSSPVQQLQLSRDGSVTAVDSRPVRAISPVPVLAPKPAGELLPLTRLSASAYEDLRHCPYRFFALRQLGLKEADELESDVDKRDFGIWLHEVLRRFHENLKLDLPAQQSSREVLLNQAADAVTASMRLDSVEFLPFSAAWPKVRDGYLVWLARHEATGAHFVQAEASGEQALGQLTLIGKIDRIDQLTDGSRLVIDYKTEPQDKTRQRVSLAAEDTQLAFYAALLPDDRLRAAYINVGEKDGTRDFEQKNVVDMRDRLIEGILHDMRQVGLGAALPALGEGVACDFCAARGLCRKDFWQAAPTATMA
jgi:ATP-dependent helicase/nuclease subunit B